MALQGMEQADVNSYGSSSSMLSCIIAGIRILQRESSSVIIPLVPKGLQALLQALLQAAAVFHQVKISLYVNSLGKVYYVPHICMFVNMQSMVAINYSVQMQISVFSHCRMFAGYTRLQSYYG